MLNSEDYYSKPDHIINDPTKFIKVNTDGKVHPIIVKENSINYYINKHLKSYDNSITSKIVSTGSTPGKLYGTIKVCKPGNPARPVVSMIDTPEYNVAKFLDQIIKAVAILPSTAIYPQRLFCHELFVIGQS